MSAQFLSVHDLAFRASCNAAAPENKRPLRRRVIERLAASPDTQALISDLQPRVSAPAGSSVFELLASDLRWKTLVAETIADTLGWDDLANRGASWGQRLVTIWRKFIEGDDQQVARIVVAVIASLGVYRIAADDSPTKPMDVKFQLSADTNAIPLSFPVSFVPQQDGMSIPVELDLRAKSEPILVDVPAQGCRKDLAVTLDQLCEATAAIGAPPKGPAAEGEALGTNFGEIKELMRRVVQLQASIVEADAGQRHEVPVDEKHPRILLVHSLDPTARHHEANLELCLASVDKPNGVASVKYSFGRKDSQRRCAADNTIKEGEIQTLTIDAQEWMVAVHSVKRRFNGQWHATFSLRPNVPQIREAPQDSSVVTVDTSD